MAHLYGDGIHDDTQAIQELIDSGRCEVALPAPEKHYLISRPLELPSNFRLVLPRFAEIKLADGSNCVMLTNKSIPHPSEHPNRDPFWHFLNERSPDHPCHNIEVRGGIWNFNNRGQNPNPLQTGVFEPLGYTGFGMLFYNVTNFTLADLTLKDPVNFAVTMDTVSRFTVENIDMDFNYGNPTAVNMDGIHLNGNCHYGVIRNLKGACYDDTVALNSDEGSCGPITNIEIAGIFAHDSHSAVRLLTMNTTIENIHIHDIYGSFYQYCVGFTQARAGKTCGRYAGITLDHINVSKADMLPVYCKGPDHFFSVLWFGGEFRIHDLAVKHLHRNETDDPIETIHVLPGVNIDSLVLEDVHMERTISEPTPLLLNEGAIGSLHLQRVHNGTDPLVVNRGTIEKIIES